MPNITNITPPRVPLTDPATGLVTREWYRFFLNLFTLTGGGQPVPSVEDLLKAPASMTPEAFAEINTLFNAALSMPSPETGELMAAIDNVSQQLQTQSRNELGTMAAVQQDNVRYLRFSNSPSPAPSTTETGTVYWDGGTTMNVVMTPHVVQAVGESQYYYIKCSEALGVKRGQVIMFDGAVGASNQLKGKLATGLTSGDYLMGVAAEDIAHNSFGLVTSFGIVASLGNQKVDTSVWPLGTILYYDPATPGGLTSTIPSAPNVKATIAAVTESSNSGAIFVRVSFGSKLGETDSNVQFSALADKDIIQYDSVLGYWKNVAPSAISIGTATNLAGGAAGSVPYQTAANTTTFLPVSTARSVLQVNANATAPEWVNAPIFGSASTTTGVQLFSGYYTAGAVAVWGGEFSSGGPVTGYCVRPSSSAAGAFLSTTPLNIARTAYTLRNGTHHWFYAPAQSVAIGSAITGVVEEMTLDSTGLSIATGDTYQINGTSVLSATTLGSGVTASSLTSVGTVTSGTWNATAIAVGYGGTGLTSGTSGGVPYFNATNTMASSAALTANALVIGGGAGAAPSTITTGTGVTTALGVNTGTAGAFVVNGGALGTPASGNFSTGTFTWPTFNQNTTGSAGSVANSVTFTNTGGAAAGTTFNGSVVRTIDYSTVGASPVAGSSSIVTVGTVTSGTWNATAVAVGYGGTGLTSGTSGGIPYFNSASTMASSAVLAADAIVLGKGAGAAPATTTTGTGVVTAIGNAANAANGLAVLNASGYLDVTKGGTGIGSLTASYVPYGAGTGAFASSSGLQFNGSSLGIGGAPSGFKVTIRTNTTNGDGIYFLNSDGVNYTNYFTMYAYGPNGDGITAWKNSTLIEAVNSNYNGNQGNFVISSYSGSFLVQTGARNTRFTIDSSGNIVCAAAALATNATNGFLYIPTCAGTPTGTPTAYTGRVPMIYDSTNNKLYIYNGAWKSATFA